MSATSTAIACSIAGGLLELAGLALVVRDIRNDRDRAGRLLEPPALTPPKPRRYPAPVQRGDVMRFRSRRKDAATMQVVDELGVMLLNEITEVQQEIEGDIDELDLAVQRAMRRADIELREELRYILAGSLRDRALGVLLLAGGIILAATGSVLGTAS